MRELRVSAGERRRVLRRFSSSIPRTFTFDVEPEDGSSEISGRVEVRGSRWLFPKPPVVLELRPTMRVDKGFWDTVYSVFITPDQDVWVTFR